MGGAQAVCGGNGEETGREDTPTVRPALRFGLTIGLGG